MSMRFNDCLYNSEVKSSIKILSNRRFLRYNYIVNHVFALVLLVNI